MAKLCKMILKRQIHFALLLSTITCIKCEFFECPETEFEYLMGDGASERQHLSNSVLFDKRLSRAFRRTVSMDTFKIPPNAAHPTNNFCGTLTLIGQETQGHKKVRLDMVLPPPEAHHLPPFSQSFVQHGSHLIPTLRGRQEVLSDFWELIVSPGRVWDEISDSNLQRFRKSGESTKWSRASFPFSLMFKEYNPQVYNGVMMFLFTNDGGGQISNVAYEIVQDTSLSFRYDYWGIVESTYNKNTFPTYTNTTNIQLDYAREVNGRIPIKDYTELKEDYGFDTSLFGRERRTSFFAFDVGGVAYAGGFETRKGIYPYPESMIVSSHSLAKTFFAALTALVMEEEFGNVISINIADLIDSADRSWDEATIENVLDMSTGHYRSQEFFVDDVLFSCDFFKFLEHEKMLDIALNCYDKKTNPGELVVYHSSDTYIAGVALRSYLEKFTDIYDIVEFYNSRITRPLGLSPMFEHAAIRTYDSYNQPISYTGLFFTRDDILKLARFMNPQNKGKLNGIQVADQIVVEDVLQIKEEMSGLPLKADGEAWFYKFGFWAKHYENEACPSMQKIPLARGFGGTIVAMFPNNTTYVSFTSSTHNDRDHNIEAIARESSIMQCI